ncbi:MULTISPECIES: hypothetical protein [Sorangium]|uniref:Uncharacterized protein n=1 Tax=Sorangium cellulosum TaxID=56 RepID=A0A4P2QTB2_SORCE|nr:MULTISPECIES: hypothetical protein [Sorangium]AUX32783.1 uncharacterized protein SOCE836_049300 [Sorangium cellulosum]WCQ92159.1 hypothetical protein NQZ70_04895 [Sorangium sp. Soce836]
MQADFPANPIEKPGYLLEFHDEFSGPSLDESKWIPCHLPQWCSAREAAANFRCRALDASSRSCETTSCQRMHLLHHQAKHPASI